MRSPSKTCRRLPTRRQRIIQHLSIALDVSILAIRLARLTTITREMIREWILIQPSTLILALRESIIISMYDEATIMTADVHKIGIDSNY